jgi:hypothetical protein
VRPAPTAMHTLGINKSLMSENRPAYLANGPLLQSGSCGRGHRRGRARDRGHGVGHGHLTDTG